MTTQTLDIDLLLRDTALLVVQLRKGEKVEQGNALWTRCRDSITSLQQTLREADYDPATVDHITYALAALLDETVLNRPQDEGSFAWLDNPLQTHFFNTFDAGNRLYDHMQRVLQETAPVPLVLSAFHRVLLLGFHGRYAPDAPEREALIAALAERIAPWQLAEGQPLASGRRGGRLWQRLKQSRLWWIICSVLLLALCWWGLRSGLHLLLTQLIPGT